MYAKFLLKSKTDLDNVIMVNNFDEGYEDYSINECELFKVFLAYSPKQKKLKTNRKASIFLMM